MAKLILANKADQRRASSGDIRSLKPAKRHARFLDLVREVPREPVRIEDDLVRRVLRLEHR
jgi:hypothetical protein